MASQVDSTNRSFVANAAISAFRLVKLHTTENEVVAATNGAAIGFTGISLAFGLAIVAAAYGLGAISGAHLNPAVSFGMVAAGRMSVGDAVQYSIAQIVGAIF